MYYKSIQKKYLLYIFIIEGNKITKEKAKRAFTIRVEQEIIDSLNQASINTRLKQATQARTYLQLSQYIVTQSDLGIEAYDETSMGIFPKKVWGSLLNSLPEEKQFELGDQLGTMILTNCGIMGISSLKKIIDYLCGLGWFDIRMFKEKDGNYYGFLANYWPIGALHAILYRILMKREYPTLLKKQILQKYLSLTQDQYKKLISKKRDVFLNKNPEIISKYQEVLDGRLENLQNNCAYYIFNKLKIEKQKKKNEHE